MALLLASRGAELLRYEVDDADGSAVLTGQLALPERIQYAARDPRSGALLVACSDGGPQAPGHRHSLVTVRGIEGVPAIAGESLTLASRPIHVAVDPAHARVAVSFNHTPGLQVWALDASGRASDCLASGLPPGAHYVHQALFMPERGELAVVCRGADASAVVAERPGSVRIGTVRGGQWAERQVLAPDGGYGFGPRNALLRAGDARLWLSLERQNRLMALALDGDAVNDPGTTISSLAAPQAPMPPGVPQLAGAIRAHPFEPVLYQVNRTHAGAGRADEPYDGRGENTLVVLALADKGAPVVIQRMPLQGVHPRTLSLDDRGRWLAVACIRALHMHLGRSSRRVQPCIELFGVRSDGSVRQRGAVVCEAGDAFFWSSFWSTQGEGIPTHAD